MKSLIFLFLTMLSLNAWATTYYWIGGTSGNWDDAANWSLTEGGEAAEVYPGKTGGYYTTPEDTATINTAVSVTVPTSSSIYIKSLTLGAETTFSGGVVFAQTISGSGKLRLNGVSLSSYVLGKNDSDTTKLTIDNPVEVCKESVNTFISPRRSDNTWGGHITLNGALTGEGELDFNIAGSGTSQYRGIYFKGDLSNFKGVFKDIGGVYSDTRFNASATGGTNASWTVHCWDRSGNGYFIDGSATAYAFGALNGRIGVSNKSGITFTIGARNEDCSFDGSMGASNKKNYIVKTGSKDLTFTGSYVAGVEIQNGTFTIGATSALPTSYIKFNGGTLALANGVVVDPSSMISSDSTGTIVFDDGGNTTEWATQISSNISGGLLKKGAGTLTLQEKPLLKGAISVEEGALILPAGSDYTPADGTGKDPDYTGTDIKLIARSVTYVTLTEDFDVGVDHAVYTIGTSEYTYDSLPDFETDQATEVSYKVILKEGYTNSTELTGTLVMSEDRTLTITTEQLVKLTIPTMDTATLVVTNAAGEVLANGAYVAKDTELYFTMTSKPGYALTAVNGTSLESAVDTYEGVISATGEELVFSGKTAEKVSTFVWTGNASTDWNTAGNWTIGGQVAGRVPNANDSVVFDSVSTVSLAAASYASNVWTETELTLSGDASNKLYNNFYYGPGRIVLNGVQLGAQLSEEMVISNDLVVAENSTNTLWLASKNRCSTYGSITGSGCLQWDCGTGGAGNWSGIYFHGTNTNFAGTFEQLRGYGGRSGMGADAWTATSSNAVWLANACSKNNTEQPFFPTGARGVYYFGAIQGSIQGGDAEPSFEIGNRADYDSDFTFLGRTTGGNVTRSCCVTKVGSSHLSVRCAGVDGNGTPSKMLKGLALKGGTTWTQYAPTTYLTFAGAGATLQAEVDPSAVIKESTTAIVFDDQGTNRTWASELAASNEGGFVKKGAGTLTLTAAPNFTGEIAVEDGALILPLGSTYDTAFGTGRDLSYTDGIRLVKATQGVITVTPGAGTEIRVVDASGTAYQDGDNVNLGETLTLTVSSLADYKNEVLYVNGVETVHGAQVAMVDGLTISSSATPITYATITEKVDDGVAAVVYTIAGADYTHEELPRFDVDDATSVSYVLTIKEGYRQTNETARTGSFVMSENHTLEVLTEKMVKLSIASVTGANLSVTNAAGVVFQDGDYVIVGTKLYLTVTPLPGYGPLATSEVEATGETVEITGTVAPVASTFVWTGATSTDWNTAGNWTIGGAVAGRVPAAVDSVIFTGDATRVTLDVMASVTNLTADCDVTISGARIQTEMVKGAGTIALGNDAGFRPWAYSSASLTISNNLEIVGTNVAFACYGSNKSNNNWGTTINILGDISGSGSFETSGIRSTVVLSGDNSKFSGTAMIRDDGVPRHDAQLASPTASSSNAVWIVERNNDTQCFLTKVGATYYFGSLSGIVNQKNTLNEGGNVTLEIGARADVPSILGGNYSRLSYRVVNEGSYIRKIGAGYLDFSGVWTQGFEVNGGTFHVATSNSFPLTYITFKKPGGTLQLGDAGDPSKLIKNSTAPIAFDDQGTNAVWSAPLAASNKGGLVKKGAGTLTLTAKPQFTGNIVVEDGALILPAGSKYTPAAGTGRDPSYTGAGIKLIAREATYATIAEKFDEGVARCTYTIDGADYTHETLPPFEVGTHTAVGYAVTLVEGYRQTNETAMAGSVVMDQDYTIEVLTEKMVQLKLPTITGATLSVTNAAGHVYANGDYIIKGETLYLTVTRTSGYWISAVNGTSLADGVSSFSMRLTATGETLEVTASAKKYPLEYTWTGDAADGLWTSTENWLPADPEMGETIPDGNDTAILTDGADITLPASDCTVGGFAIASGKATLRGRGKTLYVSKNKENGTITGAGVLALQGVYLQTETYKTITIDSALEILPMDGDDPWSDCTRFHLRGQGATVNFNGNVSGTGYLKLTADGNPNKTFNLSGSLSGFTGKLYVEEEELTARVPVAWELGAQGGDYATKVNLAVADKGAWSLNKVGSGKVTFTSGSTLASTTVSVSGGALVMPIAATNVVTLAEGSMVDPDGTTDTQITYVPYSEQAMLKVAEGEGTKLTITSASGESCRDGSHVDLGEALTLEVAALADYDFEKLYVDGAEATNDTQVAMREGLTISSSATHMTTLHIPTLAGATIVVTNAAGEVFAEGDRVVTGTKLYLSVTRTTGYWITSVNGVAFEEGKAYELELDTTGAALNITVTTKAYPQAYTWNGSAGDGLWATAANWTPADAEMGILVPDYRHEAILPDGADVTLPADSATVGVITIPSGKAILRGQGRTLYVSRNGRDGELSGEGVLALQHVYLQTENSQNISVNCSLEILPMTEEAPWSAGTQFYLRGRGAAVNFNRDIGGSGYLILNGDGNGNKSYNVYGCLADFTGRLQLSGSYDKDNVILRSAAVPDLSQAQVYVENGLMYLAEGLTNKVLKIGSFSSSTGLTGLTTQVPATLEVGAMGFTETAAPKFVTSKEGSWSVRKVGAGTLTFGTGTILTNMTVEVTEGALVMPSAATNCVTLAANTMLDPDLVTDETVTYLPYAEQGVMTVETGAGTELTITSASGEVCRNGSHVNLGENVTIAAAALADYKNVRLFVDDVEVENPCTVAMPASLSVHAEATAIRYAHIYETFDAGVAKSVYTIGDTDYTHEQLPKFDADDHVQVDYSISLRRHYKKTGGVQLTGTLVMDADYTLEVMTVKEESTLVKTDFGAQGNHVFNGSWEFLKAGAYPLADAWASTNNATWTSVTLPHSINAQDTFNRQANDAGAPGWRGISFYRKALILDGAANSEFATTNRYILAFEAPRQAIYLWVNGKKVGYYEGGIASSAFDITDNLIDGTNEVFVALDSTSGRGLNTYLSETVPGTEWNAQNGAGFQWNSNDFNPTEGGLTGNVRLYVKPKTYLTLPLYNNLKTSGTYVTASDFDFASGTATITVNAEVRNESGDNEDLAIGVTITDAGSGEVVGAFTNSAIAVEAATDAGTNFVTAVESDVYEQDEEGAWHGATNAVTKLTSGVETAVLKASASVKNLVFWSPDTPHLYNVKVTLLGGALGDRALPTALDSETIVTGFRKVAYDKDNGLTINGKYYWLSGYAQRTTDEWAAIGIPPDWLYDYDASLMRDSGANFVRWMHIAPKPKMQRALDKFGLVSVVPAGDKEADPGDGRNWSQRRETMRDVILYYRNSPSAIFWEAGNNELTAAHMHEMTEIRKTLDPSGSRMMGCRTLQKADDVAEAEWVGTMLNRHADKAYKYMKEQNRYIPILETEYAREESPRRCWDDYTGPDYDYVDRWLGSGGAKTSGYDMYDLNQEDFTRVNLGEGYAYFYGNRATGKNYKYYAGCAALCWSDSVQHGRNAWAENARMSGRVDPVRLPKRSNFRAFQVAQATVPKVAILGHWSYEKLTDDNYRYHPREWTGKYWAYTEGWEQRVPTNKTVYVVGSVHCAKVELYVNGALKGTCTEPEDIFLFRFDNIDITESGTVTAKAYAENGTVIAEDSLVSADKPDHLALTVTTGPDGWLADGNDLAMVDVQLVDKDGTMIPAATNRLEFSLSTSTANLQPLFLGGYNSGTYTGGPCGESPIGQNWVNLESGENRVFVRSGSEEDDITLTVICPDLALTNSVVLSSYEVAEGAAPQTYTANENDYTSTTAYPAVHDLGGNAEPPAYTVYLNGQPLSYATTPAKPDAQTGVVLPLKATIGALIDRGCPLETNTVDGVYSVATTNGLRLAFVEGETVIGLYYADGTTDSSLTDYEFTPTDDGDLLVEFAAVVAYLPGVAVQTDTDACALDITCITTAANYLWVGGETGAWTNAANWQVLCGDTYVATNTIPSAADTAVITNAVTIDLARAVQVSGLVISNRVSFSGAATLATRVIEGTGALVAAGTTQVKGVTDSSLTIRCDLEVPAGTTLRFAMPSNKAINFSGTLTGAGDLVVDQSGTNNRAGFVFTEGTKGDDFTGTFAVANWNTSAHRDSTSFYGPDDVSSNAAYTVWGYDNGSSSTFKTDDATYTLGALNGYITLAGKTNVTLVVGTRGEDYSFTGKLNGNKLILAAPGRFVASSSWSYDNLEVQPGAKIAIDCAKATADQILGIEPLFTQKGLTKDAFEIRNIAADWRYDEATGGVYLNSLTGDYLWTDALGDHDPGNSANWQVTLADGSYGEATSLPGLADTARITSRTVSAPRFDLSGNFSISNLVLDAETDLALIGEGNAVIFRTVQGAGTLTLSNATLRAACSTSAVYTDLAIAEGTTNRLLITAAGNYLSTYGRLTGAGTLILTVDTGSMINTYSGVRLYGDAADFTGLCQVYQDPHNVRDSIQLAAPEATSARAVYEINQNPVSSRLSYRVFTAAGTYQLGTLRAVMPDQGVADNVTLELGARNEPSFVSGAWKGYNGTVVWTAESAVYSNLVTGVSAITNSSGGTIVLGANAAPSSALVFLGQAGTLKLDTSATAVDPSSALTVDGTARCTYDDEGMDRTWSAMSLSKLEGILVKRGGGTLTLRGVPAGLILVEEGAVEVGTYHLAAGEVLVGTAVASYGDLKLANATAPSAAYLFGYEGLSTNVIRGTIGVAGTSYGIGPDLTGGVGGIAFRGGTAGTVNMNNTAPYTIGAITNAAALYLNTGDVTLNWDNVDTSKLTYFYVDGTNTLLSTSGDPFAGVDTKPTLGSDAAHLVLSNVTSGATWIYRGENASGSDWEAVLTEDPTPLEDQTQVPEGSWTIVTRATASTIIGSAVWSVGTNGTNGVTLASAGRDKVAFEDVTASVEWSAYRTHTYVVTFESTSRTYTLWIDGVKVGTVTASAELESRLFSPDAGERIKSCKIYAGVLPRDYIERDAAANPPAPEGEPDQTVVTITGPQTGTDLSIYDAVTNLVIVTNAWGYLSKNANLVEAEVRFVGDTAFRMEDGDAASTIFAYVTGDGTLASGDTTVSHTLCFQNGADFTGSILLTNAANRIAFATKMDATDWPVANVVEGRSQIYVATNNVATLKDGGRWICNTRLTIDGTLNCLGAADLSCAGGIVIDGELTYPEGYVRTDVYTDEVLTEIVIEKGVYTWTGAAGDNLWSSSNNWVRATGTSVTNQVPVAYADVVFPKRAGTNEVEVTAELTLGSLKIVTDKNTGYRFVGAGALGCGSSLVKTGNGDLAIEGEVFTMPIDLEAGSLTVDGSRLEQGVNLNYIGGKYGHVYVTAGTVTLTNDVNADVSIAADAICVLTKDHNTHYIKKTFDGAGTLELANGITYTGSWRDESYVQMSGTVKLDAGCTFVCSNGSDSHPLGTGTLDLAGATVSGKTTASVQDLGVAAIVVEAGTENTIAASSTALTVGAAISGSGTLTFNVPKNTLALTGDNSAFAGTLISTGGPDWNGTPVTIARSATSAVATWQLQATGTFTNEVYTYRFSGASSETEPFAFGDLQVASDDILLQFPAGAWVELGALNTAMELKGAIVTNAVNLVLNGYGESTWSVTDPLPAGSTITVKEGCLKLASASTDYTCGASTMMFTDGTTDYYINTKDEPPKADFTVDGHRYENGYLMMATGLLKEGSTLSLASDTGLIREFDLNVSGVTLDLGGHTISNAGNKVTWMLNVGTNALTLANGTLDCGDGYGIFVTDGSLSLSNVTIRAEGRCVQVAGAGVVRVDTSTHLITSGNDPTLMAVGGFDGRAYVEIAGSLANTCASVPESESDWRYAVAGHAQDLAGVDFVFLKGAVLEATAEGGAILKPETESGTISDNREVTPKGFQLPDDWKTSYNLPSSASADDMGENGLTYAASYLLGLDPTDETSTAVATIGFAANGDVEVTLRNATPKTDEYPDYIRFVLEDVNLEDNLSVNSAVTNRALPFTVERDETKTRQFFRVKTLLNY